LIAWDLATINPSFVYGPPLEPSISTPSGLGGTQNIWWNTVINATPEKTKEALGVQGGSAWVDVRDVAEAHVRALEREEAGGERITASSGE
jgi:nucleoside-diphosphate-sugar epimerase